MEDERSPQLSLHFLCIRENFLVVVVGIVSVVVVVVDKDGCGSYLLTCTKKR